MCSAHDIECVRRTRRIDDRAEIGGLGWRQLIDLGCEPEAGLSRELTAQPGHAFENRRMIEGSSPSDPQQAPSSTEQLHPSTDVRLDAFGTRSIGVVDDEEVSELRLELLQRLALDVGQTVEVPKDRGHRNAGPLGDVIDRRWNLAILHQ